METEKLNISFNGGEVKRTIFIRITPFCDRDKAIREWIDRNGMGFLYSFRVEESMKCYE